MLIERVIRRLRDHDNRFSDRVGGLAELSFLRPKQNVDVPAAFVLPGGEQSIGERKQGPFVTSFDLRIDLQIAVWLDANADPRNQEPTHELDSIRFELIDALMQWTPGERYHGFSYGGMQVAGQDAGRSNFLYTFSTEVSLSAAACEFQDDQARWAAEEKVALSMDRFYRAPDLFDTDDCMPKHSKGVGLQINSKPCPPCSTVSIGVLSTQMKEIDDGVTDEC